jgi:hypothetical protein
MKEEHKLYAGIYFKTILVNAKENTCKLNVAMKKICNNRIIWLIVVFWIIMPSVLKQQNTSGILKCG